VESIFLPGFALFPEASVKETSLAFEIIMMLMFASKFPPYTLVYRARKWWLLKTSKPGH